LTKKEDKRFFFEKKAPRPGKQKTFAPAGFGTCAPHPEVNESFLLLFFKKEALAYCLVLRRFLTTFSDQLVDNTYALGRFPIP